MDSWTGAANTPGRGVGGGGGEWGGPCPCPFGLSAFSMAATPGVPRGPAPGSVSCAFFLALATERLEELFPPLKTCLRRGGGDSQVTGVPEWEPAPSAHLFIALTPSPARVPGVGSGDEVRPTWGPGSAQALYPNSVQVQHLLLRGQAPPAPSAAPPEASGQAFPWGLMCIKYSTHLCDI